MRKFLLTALLIAAIAPSAAAAQAAPQTVRAQYNLSLNNMPVAVMQETFEMRDGAYQAVSETRAIGMFALLQRRPGRVTSSGKVDASGLRPEIFDGARGTRDERRVHAEFDWIARTLKLSHDGNTETVALPAGTQDRLSAMYQFLFLRPEKLKDFAFPMTNGRKLDHYRYVPGTDSEIDTPIGRFAVIHLVKQHAAGETATEIWLAREHHLMPVKMRIVEDDGKRYEQVIAQLDIS